MDHAADHRPKSSELQRVESQSLRTGPWPYQAGLPERYARNYARYLARGGLVRPEEDVRGFVAPEQGNRGDMARFYFFCLVLDQLEKEGISGDLAEMGVYKGATATLMAKIARHLGSTAYLLDTFEGFDAADLTGMDERQRVQFNDTSLEAVRALVGEDHVRYIKGHFPGSADQLPGDARYCVVHIDCDLYAPMVSALDYFYPRMVPGGFLIMHDYSSLHWDGAERAIDEFFADKVEAPIPLTDGAGSAVMRKARQPDAYNNWFVRPRAALLERGWALAANNGLCELLGSGWSGPEDWGVWGVGPSHELLLYLHSVPADDLSLEVDAYTVLIGPRVRQEVEVWVGGELLAVWEFTLQHNRDVRAVQIPATLVRTELERRRPPRVRAEFRPRDTEAPAKLDGSIRDARPLGLGVWRIRLGHAGAGQ